MGGWRASARRRRASVREEINVDQSQIRVGAQVRVGRLGSDQRHLWSNNVESDRVE